MTIQLEKLGHQWLNGFRREVSEIRPVASVLEIIGLPPDVNHCFLGIQFFADAAGEHRVIPEAGIGTVTIETVNNEGAHEAIPDNAITASSPTTVSWAANTLSVKVTPTSISGGGVTHWKAIWTGNRT